MDYFLYGTALRVFFVLSTAVCNHIVYRRPSGAATEKEQQHPDSAVSRFALLFVSTYVVVIYGVALLDVYIALCYLNTSLIHPILYHLLTRGIMGHPTLNSIQLLGISIPYFGTYLRLLCFRTLGEFFTFELAIRKDHRLCTHGPYSIVRHPSYTAVFMSNIGVGLVLFGQGSVWWTYRLIEMLAGSVLWYFWVVTHLLGVASIFGRMRAEDKALKDNFGEEWVRWYTQVPYRLIPYVY
ncbi:hypothetical protein QCA50_001067 [Cerrena zonata]|uniref:Protein-S-isoprenylcysteine O-methyltransferase n=1 Tax=Cerrena zonata TaxID=2478898 RepID=A0AAW0GYI5_9APHY